MSTKKKLEPFRHYYYVKGMIVSYDGKIVKREYDDKYMINGKNTHYLKVVTNEEGNLVVRLKKEGEIRVDKMVATCYCHKEVGQDYIIHKDKDKGNCHRYNLQWVTAKEYRDFYKDELTYTDEDTGEEWVWAREDYYVEKTGKVRVGMKDIVPSKMISDYDLGCCLSVDPYVQETRKKYGVSELIAEVFCPIPSDIQAPELIHFDNNYSNNAANNLKWVEHDSQEYKDYCQKRREYYDNLHHKEMYK